MSNKVDDWHKLISYDTNIQGELHANLLRNNGIKVSVQALSAIPGMNSGAVLWVQQADMAQAAQILEGIDVNYIDDSSSSDYINNDHSSDSSKNDSSNKEDGE